MGWRGTPAQEITEFPACFAGLHGEKVPFFSRKSSMKIAVARQVLGLGGGKCDKR
jgi:hypothetical protein